MSEAVDNELTALLDGQLAAPERLDLFRRLAADPSLQDRLDALAAARGPAIVFHAMPQRARGRIDAWGETPPSFPLMRALKQNFDPKGLCNPGRFVGGL